MAHAIAALALVPGAPAFAAEIRGYVATAQSPLADSTVTLWAAGADEPRQLAQVQSRADGGFVFNADGKGDVLYVMAKGGHPIGKTGGSNEADLLTLVGEDAPRSIVVNELTTVASAVTAAQFIHGEAIFGNPLGLRIAAGNVPNFVNL